MTPINNELIEWLPEERHPVNSEPARTGVRRRLRFEPSDTLVSIPEDRSVADFEVAQILKIIPRKEMQPPTASQNQSPEKSGED